MEEKIRAVINALSNKGIAVPKSLAEINEIPINNYSDLMNGVKNGSIRVLRFAFAMDANLFATLASASDNMKSNVGLFISYGGILAAIILSFKYSWWLLISIPFMFKVGSKITKSAYNSAIFKAAFSSELIFCFLFYLKQISVILPNSNEQIFNQSE